MDIFVFFNKIFNFSRKFIRFLRVIFYKLKRFIKDIFIILFFILLIYFIGGNLWLIMIYYVVLWILLIYLKH